MSQVTNKERLAQNNAKIDQLIELLKNKDSGGCGGDSAETAGEYFVKVIDYDGTVLKYEELDSGAVFTLPEPPKPKDGLIFTGWSSSAEIVDNSVTVTDNDIMIGATYTTQSGFTEFDIILNKATGLEVLLNVSDGTVDWGDGRIDAVSEPISHTYTDYGNYTITWSGNSVSTSYNGGIFGKNDWQCKEVRVGSTLKYLYSYMFAGCLGLKSIAVSNHIESVSDHVFHQCGSLSTIVFPKLAKYLDYGICEQCNSLKDVVVPFGTLSIGVYAFSNCWILEGFAIPSTIKFFGYSAFSGCHNIKHITVPDTVTSFGEVGGNGIFYQCYNLRKLNIPNGITWIGDICTSCLNLTEIVLPGSVTSISNTAFRGSYNILKIKFTNHMSVPSLSGTMDSLNRLCKIIVPDALYEEWINATNWVTVADYIYAESEVE